MFYKFSECYCCFLIITEKKQCLIINLKTNTEGSVSLVRGFSLQEIYTVDLLFVSVQLKIYFLERRFLFYVSEEEIDVRDLW